MEELETVRERRRRQRGREVRWANEKKKKERKRKERLSRKTPFPLLHTHTERARGGHKEHGKVTNVWL